MFNYGNKTISEFDIMIKQILNPNNPSSLGTNNFQSYQWVKNLLNELGVTFDDEISSAWNMFLQLDDTNLKYLKKPSFSLGVLNGFDNNELSKEIEDGSIVFGYFPGSPYVLRAIDEMYFLGLKGTKENELSKFLAFDTKANINPDQNNTGWYDSTPMNKLKFSEVGYQSIWPSVKNKGLVDKKIPIVPINHIGIFSSNHLFHLCSSVLTEPSEELRIVAHYPLKKMFKLAKIKNIVLQGLQGLQELKELQELQGLQKNNGSNLIKNLRSGEELINKLTKDMPF
jgi:hypothetical protein